MKILIILLIAPLFAISAHAHNMSNALKKKKIIDAVAHISKNITHYDIQIDANPLNLDFDLQAARLDPGDKDIDSFVAGIKINEQEHQIACDILSGEYGEERAIYFIVYKNCYLVNLETFRTKEISLAKQAWDDWKY